MKSHWVAVLGTVIVVGVGHSVLADTLPPGATPISGTAHFIRVGSNADVFLPVDVPEGQLFVLTDISIPLGLSKLTQVFGQEDLTNARFEGRASPAGSGSLYRDTFQTGLVFTSAPLIRVFDCYNPFSCFNPFETDRVSFSGYLKPAP
jgi:hypothetical protein